jgi:hypothetical protein
MTLCSSEKAEAVTKLVTCSFSSSGQKVNQQTSRSRQQDGLLLGLLFDHKMEVMCS